MAYHYKADTVLTTFLGDALDGLGVPLRREPRLESRDARRLRQLGQENERLKKLLADSMLDNAMLKEISAEKF